MTNINVIDPRLPNGHHYAGIVIRPPCEAYSVLIGVTEGCRWNRCAFCGVYKGIQSFRIRDVQEIVEDLVQAEVFHGREASRVFLAGGSALSAPTDLLLEVLAEVRSRFPRAIITSYAKNLDILSKSEDELRFLRLAGLKTLYMGLESGSDEILRIMRKGTDAQGMIDAASRAADGGLELSLYVILGLGGSRLTQLHSKETARVLNEISPPYTRFRTLNVMRNSPLFHWVARGDFLPLSPLELLKEQYEMLSALNCSTYVFNDHISNYEAFEGQIPEQKSAMLKLLQERIRNPVTALLEHKRLLSM